MLFLGIKDAMLYVRCVISVCVCVCVCVCEFLIRLRLRHNEGRLTLGLGDHGCLTPSQERILTPNTYFGSKI